MNAPASASHGAAGRSVVAACAALAAVVVLLFLGQAAAAQSAEPISANRPGFNEATATLRRGQIQIEVSGNMDQFGSGASTWSEPFHLRVGVHNRFELRVHSNGMLRITEPGAATTGFSDLTFGAAWHTTDEHGLVPASSVIGYVSVPSGSRETRGAAASPSVFVPMSWTLPAGRGVALMPGVGAVNEGEGFYAFGALAGAVTQAIGERVVVFGEIAGESLRSAARGGSIVTVGTGGAVRVGLRDQFDVGVSRRASAIGPTARVYAGWSRRIRD